MLLRLRGRLGEQKGISAVIAVVSLLGIFGAALLSVDAGNMWSTRRIIVSGTDSSALDEARKEAAAGNVTCEPTYTDYLIRNTDGFIVGSEDCGVEPHPSIPGTGYVWVEAQKSAETRFGGLFGIGNTEPYSYSAAQFYYPLTLEGLRPIGICAGNHHYKDEWVPYQNWILNNSTPAPNPLYSPTLTEAQYNALASDPEHQAVNSLYPSRTGLVHRIDYSPDQAEDLACGNDPGNWGWQDFTPGSPGEAELIDWVLNGYNGEVGIDDCDADYNPEAGTGETGDGCEGGPGGGGGNNPNCRAPTTNLGEALRCMVGKTFPVVIYDQATCTTPQGNQAGGGNNCSYHVVGFLGVILRGFDIATGQSNRYFDFEFVNLQRTGRCCATSPNQSGVKAIRLCNVDHDTSGKTDAQRCA